MPKGQEGREKGEGRKVQRVGHFQGGWSCHGMLAMVVSPCWRPGRCHHRSRQWSAARRRGRRHRCPAPACACRDGRAATARRGRCAGDRRSASPASINAAACRYVGPVQITSRLISGSWANAELVGVGSPRSMAYENVSPAKPRRRLTTRRRVVPSSGNSPPRTRRDGCSGPAHSVDRGRPRGPASPRAAPGPPRPAGAAPGRCSTCRCRWDP
jgi:hypothetical protein